ncbi:hypothetical protein LXA47_32550 [Massilia sp. P8910]|uniref:hypothetical protein n=1 Tax=Massilia antarctica TaxID=2765360 RepID=UPI001E30A9AD|nr:hypothetical protein [Massilia antarctica]MCE3608300.1 hypothetical protein [Massilia antarctica]
MPPVILIAHDQVGELGHPTLYQVRNAAAPWLRAELPEDDIEDVEFARSWALRHDGVDTLGTLQGKYRKAQ